MAKKRTPKKIKPVTELDHPSQDRTNRFEVDALLRQHGYKIFARFGRDVWWELGGRIYLEEAALDTIDQYMLADAEYIEHLYWEGFPE
jgi:hypothetical protein